MHYNSLLQWKIISKNLNNVTAHIQKPAHWQMDTSICKTDTQKLPKK